ncbi:MAG: hypothetical protein GXO54_04640 [Chloroflexi bacterium]|nr:hypothetical protein [Chloroflexota bacterium]
MKIFRSFRFLIFVGLAFSGLNLVACSGLSGLLPASLPKMATFEGETFTVEYPEEWNYTSDSLLGMEIVLFSTQPLSSVDVFETDPNTLVKEGVPLVMIITMPKELAGDLVDDPQALYDEVVGDDEENVTVLEQGETTIGGAQGYQLVLKGYDEDLDRDIGGYIVVGQREDDGQVVLFMAITSRDNVDQDLRIFEHMHKTFTLKTSTSE